LDRTRWLNGSLFVVLSLGTLGAAACGEEPKGAKSGTEKEPSGEDNPVSTKECSTEGQSRACSCANGEAGRKTCKDGAYTECANCVKTESNTKPTTSVPQCKAGYYTGAFTGKYKPGAFGFGIGMSLLEVDIMGEMSNGRPALAMTLEEDASNEGGEFYTVTVGNGCMTGVAKAVGTNNPFVARLTGDLDCNTGNFVGTLEGKYTLLDLSGLEFKFKGPLTAKFDVPSSSLKDGAWSVQEPPALTGDPAGGGEGTWGAEFTSDKAPDSGVDPCAVLEPSTGPADAGVLTGRDAGSSDAGAP